MASDRVTTAHTPRFLQNVSLSFRNRQFIADRVSPRIRVPNQSDKYRVWGKDFNVVDETRWAPGTIPNETRLIYSSATFYAELRKIRALLLRTELRNADDDLD